MNERIKKMMNDSRPLVAMESLSSWDELQKYADDWTERFAELIVRECAEIASVAEPFKSDDLILSHFGLNTHKEYGIKE